MSRFNSGRAKDATTKERVAMAAGWHIADMIPDRAYTLMGRWLVHYWEADILRPGRFEALESLARDLGTLAEATVFPVETARTVVHAFAAELMARQCDLPEGAMDIADGWFESGRGLDPRRLINDLRDLGDPSHQPSPPRPVCRHCGAAQ